MTMVLFDALDMASILASAMAGRRGAMKEDNESESEDDDWDEDDDDEDWD